MSTLDILFKKAFEARNNAYAPYSEFKVGAAVLTAKGNIYTGANVENVSYPCGTCAEQSAIAAMIGAGEYEICDILITAGSQNLITPCGACLQRILEFSNKNTIVHLSDLSGIKKSYPLTELLPHGFNQDLKK
ncbi:MAG: cytidine deaminase [Alphaproteobacteria bacterium]|nr:cytidine deaminase [Alphaproteobacteria bacterium]